MSFKNALVVGFSLILATLLLQCQEIHGKEFLVGDEKGWSQYPGISDWPNGKNFTPGDVLVFKYDNTSTNVWLLDFGALPEYPKNCYETCETYLCGFTEFNSGNDRVELREGENYFLSSSYDTCIQGFKLKLCAEFDGKRKNCV